MQSLYWAAARRCLGYRVLHLVLEDGATLVGGLLAYAPPAGRPVGVLAAPEGPVLPWADAPYARAGLRLLLAAVEAAAPEFGAAVLHVEPRLPPPRPALL